MSLLPGIDLLPGLNGLQPGFCKRLIWLFDQKTVGTYRNEVDTGWKPDTRWKPAREKRALRPLNNSMLQVQSLINQKTIENIRRKGKGKSPDTMFLNFWLINSHSLLVLTFLLFFQLKCLFVFRIYTRSCICCYFYVICFCFSTAACITGHCKCNLIFSYVNTDIPAELKFFRLQNSVSCGRNSCVFVSKSTTNGDFPEIRVAEN